MGEEGGTVPVANGVATNPGHNAELFVEVCRQISRAKLTRIDLHIFPFPSFFLLPRSSRFLPFHFPMDRRLRKVEEEKWGKEGEGNRESCEEVGRGEQRKIEGQVVYAM